MGPRVPLALGVAFAVSLGLGCACGRRTPSDAELDRGPGTSPQAEAPPGSHAARRPTALSRQSAAAEPQGPLPLISAEELVSRIKASGKKGTLVNAWASFCGPCRRELPMLETLAANYRTQGIEVMLVSVDAPEDADKALAFLATNGVTLTSTLARPPLGDFKAGMNPRWPGMVPASFLFDAQGRLRYFWGGEAFEEELLPVLDALVAGRPIDGEADFIVAPGAPPLPRER
jgi:thiol-disulfide isomerase/thioredoxin